MSTRIDNRPTICQLLHGLPVGGAEVLAFRIAQQLGDRYRFVFACLDQVGELGEELRRDGVPVKLLGRRSGFDWRCTHRLSRILSEEDVSILHAHQYTPFFYGLTARLVGKRCPIVFTEHGRWYPDYPRRKRILFNRFFIRGCDRLFGVGEGVRQALITNEGMRPDQVGVIYNGIDLSPHCDNGFDDRAQIRADLGLGPDNFVIVQVARLDSLKDHCTAIRTIERLAARNEKVRLLLVGEGPERERIETEIKQRGVAKNVKMLGLRRDVPHILRAADACLLTSISEGIPLTLIEAMAAGLPIVSTDVGGVPEIVTDSETGLLASAGDDAALAKALLRLIASPQQRQELGARGRIRAQQHFCESQMHAKYRQVFDEILNSRTKRTRHVAAC